MKTTCLTGRARLSCLLLIVLFPLLSNAQVLGDYRTKNTNASWSTASDWQVLEPFLIIFTAWNDATVPPPSTVSVYIQSGHTATMTSNQTCNNLSLTGSVNIGSNTLTVNGTIGFSGGNLVSNGSSSLVLNGGGDITMQFSQTTPGVTNKYQNITINRTLSTPSLVTLSNNLQVSGTLNIQTGALVTVNYLTLLSTSSGTARLATIDTTKGNITGNVIVQRYIPGGKREWRFLACPVTTSSGINGNWQQQVYLTGPVSTGGSICPSFAQNTNNGLDPTQSGNYSFQTYSEASRTFVSTTNTLTTNMAPGAGYKVFVRGQRSQGCVTLDGSTYTPNAVTLSAQGAVGKGTVSVSIPYSGDGWCLVGNPYPSSINWDASGWNTARTTGGNNINNAIYIYNPALAVPAYSSYVNGVSDGNGATNIISSGQAFFVRCTAASLLQFKESYKTATENNIFGKTGEEKPLLQLSFVHAEGKNACAIYFEEGASTAFDAHLDALKMTPGKNQLASLGNDETVLSINARPFINEDAIDTIKLYTGLYEGITGSLKLQTDINTTGKQVYVYDRFLNKLVPIKNAEEGYTFRTDANNAASYANDRFMIMLTKTEMATGLTTLAETAKAASLYPNPASDAFRIMTEETHPELEVRIYNTLGQLISTHALLCSAGISDPLDAGLLPKGLYYLEIKSTANTYFAKLEKE